jgi:hypothetical protein
MLQRTCHLVKSVLAVLLLAGCGPTTAHVSGTVTFNGVPVPTGTVSFVMSGGVFQSEIRDGRYDIPGIPPGLATVTVVRLDPAQADPYESVNRTRRQMVEKRISDPRQIDPNVITDAGQLDLLNKQRYLLPASYAAPETSGLRFAVSPGLNTFAIELNSKGP